VIREFSYALKYLLGKDVAGRNLIVLPDDVFLVSYPRSGNTWCRFLLASLISPHEPVTFKNIERLIPDIYVQPKRYLRKLPRPRTIKSHEYFDPRYKKVIYIVRDPRDVALSYYRFHLKFGRFQRDHSIEQYTDSFVAGELDNYGSWGENVGSWLVARHDHPSFLLLHYETLAADPVAELAKVARFLGIEATTERLALAVERSSVDRMRQLEAAQADKWIVTQGRRKDIPFVGAANPGGWKSALSPESVATIEAAWSPLMLWLGYELVSPGRTSIRPGTTPVSILE
jgi:hypothetical protein